MGNLIRTTPTALTHSTSTPAFPQPPRSEIYEISRIWKALAKRKWLIVMVTLVTVIPVAAYSFLVKPTFLSTVRIQIDPESVKVLPYNALSDQLLRAPSADFELYMKTQDELLRSPALYSRTLARLREESKQDPLPLLPGGFSDGLRVERIQGSQIVKINYESLNPAFSALAANVLAEEFIKLHFERKVETTSKAAAFLEEQLSSLKQKVDQAEADLFKYARQNSILDTNENQGNIIRQQFGIFSSDVARARSNYLSKLATVEQLKSVTVEEFPESLRGNTISSLEAKANDAEQELSRLLAQFGENWPQVVQKRKELVVTRQQLVDEKKSAIDRARREAQMRLSSAQGEYDLLNETLKKQQSAVNKLNEATIQYNTLKRDLDASEQLYQGLLQRLKETGVSAGLEFGNINITDRAKADRVPYSPKPAWNISLALVLGLSLGTVLAFFLEYTDRSLRNPHQLEDLGLPLLGWVPTTAIKEPKRGALESGPKGTGGALTLTANAPKSTTLPAPAALLRDARTREAFRSICAALLLSRAENPARTILVTSAVAREGKTTTVTNLGVTLAEAGQSTLLIDADFRNPSLSNRFGAGSAKGLSIFLAGGELDIRETQMPGLFLFPAGPLPPNPVALFTSPRFLETLDSLRQQFRFVLFDGPPVLSVADSAIVSSKVDGVILVVKAGDTPEDAVTQAHLQLARSGATVLGAAFNQVDLKNPDYGYYKKYYYSERYLQAQQRPAGQPLS